jgi:epoxyqueuosine reductase
MPTSTSSPQAIVNEIRARAKKLGFDAFGITSAAARPDLREKLEVAVGQGWYGDMEWMGETAERRASPQALWEQARSVIMLGVNYGPDRDPMETLTQRDRGTISVYARNDDYHELIKGRLKEIAILLERRSGAKVKVFVDTAPVMEKPLAEAAGLGWQGKHTVLVSREYGSWLFLGAIFTTAELPADAPHEESCGTCQRCLEVCPTNAFPAPFQLDARRCLSYLNIEHRGPIPHEFRVAMGNRIYGCDDCLAVCPWNKFASVSHEARLMARDDLNAPGLSELVALDDAEFRDFFSRSPIKRIGHARFLRNVLIAIGNSADPRLLPSAQKRLDDPDPLIRGAAVWAVRRLAPAQEASRLALDFLPREGDTSVRLEWTAELPA